MQRPGTGEPVCEDKGLRYGNGLAVIVHQGTTRTRSKGYSGPAWRLSGIAMR